MRCTPLFNRNTLPQRNGHLDINFRQLACQDVDFAAKWVELGQRPDWQDAEFNQLLTICTLRTYFHVNVQLRDDRLCPPVPIRWSYIQWVERLIADTDPYFFSSSNEDDAARENILGIDIGTGSSCIFPLLACAANPSWSFIGTDVDWDALKTAALNIQSNPTLSSRIMLLLHSPSSPLIPVAALTDRTNDNAKRLARFVMCNPPFYTSQTQMEHLASQKNLPPSAVFLGNSHETVTQGGELAFITRLIHESTILRSQIQWYTTMVGLSSTVQQVLTLLRRAQVTHYVSTTLKSGGTRTRRWIVAWTFDSWRPTMDVIYASEPNNYSLYTTETSIAGVADLAAVRHAFGNYGSVDWKRGKMNDVALVRIDPSAWQALGYGGTQTPSRKSGDGAVDDDEETWIRVQHRPSKRRLALRWMKGPSHEIFGHYTAKLRKVCGGGDTME